MSDKLELAKMLVVLGDVAGLEEEEKKGVHLGAGGDALLGLAAMSGKSGCVEYLIPRSSPRQNASYSLRVAALGGHMDCVRLLIPVSNVSAAKRALKKSGGGSAAALISSVEQEMRLTAAHVSPHEDNNAESLLVSNGATSAVDRLHTALHGYLRSACADAGIAVAADASITALLKTLKSEHPGIKELGVHSAELVKVLNSFGNIVDALNTLRNHASVAHANENLLEQDEALLIVNAVRTLFNYLVKKLG